MRTTLREVCTLGKKNGNYYWSKAIINGTNNVSVAFGILEEGEQPLPMHSFMPCYMVFDVKMYFTRKSHYVDTGCNVPNSNDSR